MRNPGEIWRLRAWVWLPALLFFLGNATAYSIYRFGFADRVAALKADLKDQREQLEPLEARKTKIAGLLERSRSNQVEIQNLYNGKFATRKQRLTSITAEVKSLARKAGLNPTALSYPEQQIQQYGLVKRSFIFSVQGTYIELRKFINLLELSNSFLTLESVQLTESAPAGPALPTRGRGGPPGMPPGINPGGVQPGVSTGNPDKELQISLTLSTIFVRDPNAPEAVPGLRRGGV